MSKLSFIIICLIICIVVSVLSNKKFKYICSGGIMYFFGGEKVQVNLLKLYLNIPSTMIFHQQQVLEYILKEGDVKLLENIENIYPNFFYDKISGENNYYKYNFLDNIINDSVAVDNAKKIIRKYTTFSFFDNELSQKEIDSESLYNCFRIAMEKKTTFANYLELNNLNKFSLVTKIFKYDHTKMQELIFIKCLKNIGLYIDDFTSLFIIFLSLRSLFLRSRSDLR